MNILQINHIDVEGERYNGRRLNEYFRAQGHSATQCVIDKVSQDEHVWQLFDFAPNKRWPIRKKCLKWEKRYSLQSLLYPFPLLMFGDRRFYHADIVHLHLIHVNFFSLFALPPMTWLKPTVWTLHDLWAITGHCIHPNQCLRWLEGCGECPDLACPFPLHADRTRLLWQIKHWCYRLSKIDVVVASKFMYDRAKQSPLLSKFSLHLIPFGIDMNLFRHADITVAKARFGIPENSVVISFRSSPWGGYKGLDAQKAILAKVINAMKERICLLTCDQVGHFKEFEARCDVVELGWVKDEATMAHFYQATDIFIMPSEQESFGIMAVEAMACGKPVIVFDGSALPDTVYAPQGGIAVPSGDIEAFSAKLLELIDQPAMRERLGEQASVIAHQHYDFQDHARKIFELYTEVIRKRNLRKGES